MASPPARLPSGPPSPPPAPTVLELSARRSPGSSPAPHANPGAPVIFESPLGLPDTLLPPSSTSIAGVVGTGNEPEGAAAGGAPSLHPQLQPPAPPIAAARPGATQAPSPPTPTESPLRVNRPQPPAGPVDCETPLSSVSSAPSTSASRQSCSPSPADGPGCSAQHPASLCSNANEVGGAGSGAHAHADGGAATTVGSCSIADGHALAGAGAGAGIILAPLVPHTSPPTGTATSTATAMSTATATVTSTATATSHLSSLSDADCDLACDISVSDTSTGSSARSSTSVPSRNSGSSASSMTMSARSSTSRSSNSAPAAAPTTDQLANVHQTALPAHAHAQSRSTASTVPASAAHAGQTLDAGGTAGSAASHGHSSSLPVQPLPLPPAPLTPLQTLPATNRQPAKFKTRLCQYYRKTKLCPYGLDCFFAHGNHDLVRPLPVDHSTTASANLARARAKSLGAPQPGDINIAAMGPPVDVAAASLVYSVASPSAALDHGELAAESESHAGDTRTPASPDRPQPLTPTGLSAGVQASASASVTPRRPVNKDRIKTKLCRNFDAGSCAFGDACCFAHGQAELRTPTPSNPNSSLSAAIGGGISGPRTPPRRPTSAPSPSAWPAPASVPAAAAYMRNGGGGLAPGLSMHGAIPLQSAGPTAAPAPGWHWATAASLDHPPQQRQQHHPGDYAAAHVMLANSLSAFDEMRSGGAHPQHHQPQPAHPGELALQMMAHGVPPDSFAPAPVPPAQPHVWPSAQLPLPFHPYAYPPPMSPGGAELYIDNPFQYSPTLPLHMVYQMQAQMQADAAATAMAGQAATAHMQQAPFAHHATLGRGMSVPFGLGQPAGEHGHFLGGGAAGGAVAGAAAEPAPAAGQHMHQQPPPQEQQQQQPQHHYHSVSGAGVYGSNHHAAAHAQRLPLRMVDGEGRLWSTDGTVFFGHVSNVYPPPAPDQMQAVGRQDQRQNQGAPAPQPPAACAAVAASADSSAPSADVGRESGAAQLQHPPPAAAPAAAADALGPNRDGSGPRDM